MKSISWKIGSALLLALVVWALMGGFAGQQRVVAAIFALTVVLWSTEAFPIGITALLSMALLVLVADFNERTAFSGMGDPIIPLFICGLILAKAVEVTGLGRRFALSILGKERNIRTPGRLLLVLCIITAGVSLFLSNTATTAMMYPIGLSILTALGAHDRKYPYAVALLLSLSFAAAISVGTPIGTAPDLIAVSDIAQSVHREIGFLQWAAFGVPITLIMLFFTWFVLNWMFGTPAPDTASKQEALLEQGKALGKMTQAEWTALIVLATAVVLWIAPSVTEYTIKGPWPSLANWFQLRLTSQTVAILAVLLLFLIPVKDTESGRVLTWKQAVQIDWGVILLFGGGISLGIAFFDCGLAKELGAGMARLVHADTIWSITALGIGVGIVMSEFTSNISAAAALLPMIIGLSQGAGVSPVAPALGTALGVSLGFVFPFSTPTNAIVYSSNLISQKEMMKAGAIIDFIGFFVIYGCLRMILPLIGLT